jgi:hypothetical protein
VSDEAQEWRWVGEDGVEKAVSEHELIAELSSESLPRHTLVWKNRWLEWLPAMQVAELAWALPPGKAERAVKARESPLATEPPAPPLYLYPVLKRRAGSATSDARPEPPRPGAATRENRFIEPPTVPLDSRPVEDVDLESIAPSAPGNAPATRTGARAYSLEDDGETEVLRSRPPQPARRPPPLEPVYVGPHTPPPSEIPGPTYDENEIPHIPRPPGSPSDLSAYARFSTDSDLELELEEPDPPRRPLKTIVLACGAAVLGIGAALLTLRGLGALGHAAPESAASAAASASARAAPAPLGVTRPRKEDDHPQGAPCTVTTPPTRVADWAEPLVSPTLAPIPGSSRLAIGFAQSDTFAIGMTIDPRTLDRDQVFRDYHKEKLVSVVPMSKSGKLRFEVVRQGYPLANARLVDATTPFALGTTSFSIARVDGASEPVTLWSFADADQSTLPRVVPVTGDRYAVALRRGGKSGPVAVGYLDRAGNKRSELVDVGGQGASGTPSLATDGTSLLVAFATKPSSAPWGIAAASSPVGEGPRKPVKVELRDGGPGGDRISPTVGALGGERWLLQWTEGSASNRMVRAEILDRNLAPLTEAVNLSPDGANAGQAVSWTSGDLATILFYVKNDKSNNELWGVALDCPR